MSGEPEVTIVGTLGGDPEIRFTTGGVGMSTFSVAVNSRKKDGDSWVDDGTTWYRCTAWREMAENISESLTKGCRVIVQGRLRTREYKDREGNDQRSGPEITVDAIGPELRWATVTVARVQRSGGYDQQPQQRTQQRGQRPERPADPWDTAPVGAGGRGQQAAFGGGYQDEPPF